MTDKKCLECNDTGFLVRGKHPTLIGEPCYPACQQRAARTLTSKELAAPGGAIGPQNPAKPDGGSSEHRESVGPLGWTLEQFVVDGLATCRSQIAIKVGKDREGWVKDEWYWMEMQRRLEKAHGNETCEQPTPCWCPCCGEPHGVDQKPRPANMVHDYSCTECMTPAGSEHRPGCRMIRHDQRATQKANEVLSGCAVRADIQKRNAHSDAAVELAHARGVRIGQLEAELAALNARHQRELDKLALVRIV